MKPFLFYSLFLFSALCSKAQTVTALPLGKYETKTKTQNKWEKGDIIIVDDSHYKLGSDNDMGEYRFSVAAQRIFFTSGPLKSAYTKLALNNNKAVIIFPMEQNQDLGITAEIWASRQ